MKLVNNPSGSFLGIGHIVQHNIACGAKAHRDTHNIMLYATNVVQDNIVYGAKVHPGTHDIMLYATNVFFMAGPNMRDLGAIPPAFDS